MARRPAWNVGALGSTPGLDGCKYHSVAVSAVPQAVSVTLATIRLTAPLHHFLTEKRFKPVSMSTPTTPFSPEAKQSRSLKFVTLWKSE